MDLGDDLTARGPAPSARGDAPSVDDAAPAVVPSARTGPDPRLRPERDPGEAMDPLVTRPESPRPLGGDTG
ncbi:hypothetical protein GTY83_07600 [Streptomyces sp. SID4928]|uniref:hypothetical protein n=1 Tax=unclassified Streptomyces TaxID=2593676 RepID=UPI0001C1BEAE|nr:hypothetical protein [Streptomyces sp. ACT-1]EGE40909.1 hypothetical protein SACT1_1544 [Streptomyces sp. ACT-1]MYR48971.1 hypothetical protein [Streptomyces sp. SID4928]